MLNAKPHVVAALLIFAFIGMLASGASAQNTSFKYQGKLNEGGSLATGTYDMTFAIFDSPTDGVQIGSTITLDGAGSNPAAVQVSNGIFSVELDFGATPFAVGSTRFLEIAVKKPADSSYTTLSPRQKISSAPYAIYATQAGYAAGADLAGDSLKLGGNLAANFLTTSGGTVNGSFALTGNITANNAHFTGSTLMNTLSVTGSTWVNTLSATGLISTTYDGMFGRDINVIRNANIYSDLNIGGTTYAHNFYTNGNANIGGNLTTQGDGRITGTTMLDGPLFVGGNSNFYSNVTVNGNLTVNGVITGDGSGLTNLNATKNIVVPGSSLTLEANKAYALWQSGTPSLLLPASPTSGDTVKITGNSDSGFRVDLNSGQVITTGPTDASGTSIGAFPSNFLYEVDTNADGSIILSASDDGIARSTDYGATWTTIKTPGVRSVAMSADGNIIYASFQGGLIKTVGGGSWTDVYGSGDPYSVATSADGNTVIFGSAFGQLYVSTDGGTNWTVGGMTSSWKSVNVTSDGSKLFAVSAYDGIWRSTNNGVTWTYVADVGESYQSAISADGSKMIVGTWGSGFSISTDSGTSWTQHYSNDAFLSVGMSASGNTMAAGGYNMPMYISKNGGASFATKNPAAYYMYAAVSGDGKVIYGSPLNAALVKFNPTGSSTTAGGYLVAAPETSIELIYVGSDKWMLVTTRGSVSLF